MRLLSHILEDGALEGGIGFERFEWSHASVRMWT
ncbi:Uncharacterized protein TCM_016432 [Theobroma cacao]|uniref:Uncharacterized protein n=1 Tax=Theobroma cacao TaxID=3641 RepID=A0A061G5Y5_THECC|nr:Uncharacterized protein TCM_016432 [Theobroma cacao]